MTTSWIDLLSAAISGGFILKVLDILYSELKLKSEASKSAKALMNKHLDPILKATDELVAKINSLAVGDFSQLPTLASSAGIEEQIPLTSILYYFGEFWSRIQILRIEGIYVNLGAIESGKRLRSLIRTLETTRIRILDRALQRGIGESLIQERNGQLKTITYYEFAEKYQSSEKLRFWYKPLISALSQSVHVDVRQKILVYGAILHSLIDTLDPKHLTTGIRPGWPNKLTKKSSHELKYRIFPIYLPFVKNPEKYFQTRA
jgi:hypothetical protein